MILLILVYMDFFFIKLRKEISFDRKANPKIQNDSTKNDCCKLREPN
jgi:hypothetical protein